MVPQPFLKIVHFWHQAITEHFDFLSETVLLKCRKWKYILKCLIISALLQVALL